MKHSHHNIIRSSLIFVAFIAIASYAFAGMPDGYTYALMGQKAHAGIKCSRSDEKPPYLPLIIQIDDESVVDTLLSMGTIIWHRRDNLALASLPYEYSDSIENLGGVGHIAASKQIAGSMDIARPYCGADMAQSGVSLPKAYDGKGIITGFSDIGFDATHIAFKDRVEAFFNCNARQGTNTKLTDPGAIQEYKTDNAEEWHATHVANIMAGGYMGNQYYGVAPASTIVAAANNSDDVGILCNIEDIISYAKQKGMPAVINVSMSSNIGPHDGTGLFCQYVSKCGKDAVICFSAGNYGNKTVSAQHQFQGNVNTVRATVNNIVTSNGFEVYGVAQAWCANDAPLEMRVEVFDLNEGKIAFASPWIGGSFDLDTLRVTPEAFPEWGEMMQGNVFIATELSTINNRFCATAVYETETEEVCSKGNWSRYLTSLAYRGSIGTSIDVYTDAYMSYLSAVGGPESLKPNAEQSISDMCTADNVISVGACSTRNSAPKMPEGKFEWNFSTNEIAGFSSYGLGLPNFSAPGNFVVSAISTEYMANFPDTPVSACCSIDGRDYCWVPACGTSMSAPYAAGTMALWLQANPNLGVNELRDIAIATANTDFADINNPKWGAGCLDSYEGLKKCIASHSIIPSQINSNQPLVKINPDMTLDITVDGRTDLKGTLLYTISGTKVDVHSPLSSGIYILNIPAYPPIKIIIP